MELSTAVALIDTPHIQTGVQQVWADLGAGAGLFTQALAHYLPAGSTIIAVDKERIGLKKIGSNERVALQTITADFTANHLPLTGLTGILMANALHFVKDKAAFINNVGKYFANNKGRFLLVEYDTEQANPWVPYPISFPSLKQLFNRAGYNVMEKIGETPSIYGPRNIYSAWIE